MSILGYQFDPQNHLIMSGIYEDQFTSGNTEMEKKNHFLSPLLNHLSHSQLQSQPIFHRLQNSATLSCVPRMNNSSILTSFPIGFLIDVLHHKLIQNFSKSSGIEIARTIQIFCSNCFSWCESLSSITFESNSHLTRIESEAFSSSSLESILIPRNVEILGSTCFYNCKSLSSIIFEPNSCLTRIESRAFHESSLQSILIPSTILFIAYDAVRDGSQIRLVDENSCPEFDRWLQLKGSGIEIDFRRIQRVGFDVSCLRDYVVNLSVFEERSIISDSEEVPNEISHRIEDEFGVSVKLILLLETVEKSEIENELEKLINLRHPCIAGPIGFVFPIESDSLRELKIVRLYLEGCSLLEVFSINPMWWTSTVKAKAVAGIVLSLDLLTVLDWCTAI
jgi:hypothetical protein